MTAKHRGSCTIEKLRRYEMHRSFASLRMTRLRFDVILSGAKDLYVAFCSSVRMGLLAFCKAINNKYVILL